MVTNNLLAIKETVLTLHYIPALQKPETENELDHPDWVGAVSGGVDGYLSTGCYDGNIRLYNTTGKCLATQFGHKQAVKALAMAKTDDGVFHIASGGKDQNVRMWQVDFVDGDTALSPVGICEGHRGGVEDLAIHRQTHKLASASWDGTIQVWDLPGNKLLGSGDGRVAKRQRTAASPDEPQKPTLALTDHTQCVSCVRWVSSSTLCSGSWDHSVKIWDVNKGECATTLQGNKVISALAVGPTSTNTVVTAHPDFQLRVWDTRTDGTGLVTSKLSSHKKWVSDVAWSTASAHLLVSTGSIHK